MPRIFRHLLLIYIFTFLPLAVAQENARTWKALLVSGDDSIPNFDNARRKMQEILLNKGLKKSNIRNLTSNNSLVSGSLLLGNSSNLQSAFSSLKINNKSDGCFIFLTSHGAHNDGFLLLHNSGERLYPSELAQLVNSNCGTVPTIILVSACYSGQFITQELKGPNRVILTAAAADRSSFGCSAESTYTYWDSCILSAMVGNSNWRKIYQQSKNCVEQKEQETGYGEGESPSLPQAYFGRNYR